MSTTTLAVNLYEMDYILLQGPSNRKFGLLSRPKALARLSDPDQERKLSSRPSQSTHPKKAHQLGLKAQLLGPPIGIKAIRTRRPKTLGRKHLI
ncbi:hypothetical protein YC2023_101238 [Brassica napus]|uniref:Uncharacterized protein n=1 Tax=Brassica oleracea var. oleracea TaxID=109376 RepID=A0A0D3DQJ9_BRAOL